jgi:hypothetical protein
MAKPIIAADKVIAAGTQPVADQLHLIVGRDHLVDELEGDQDGRGHAEIEQELHAPRQKRL